MDPKDGSLDQVRPPEPPRLFSPKHPCPLLLTGSAGLTVPDSHAPARGASSGASCGAGMFESASKPTQAQGKHTTALLCVHMPLVTSTKTKSHCFHWLY